MCGRFTLATSTETLARYFELLDVPTLTPRYNIAPGQDIAVIRQGEAGRDCVMLRWGLVPSWSKAPKTTYRTINARAETVADKPAYRQAFRQRRCLIPASGFYEWQARDGGKVPYHIRLKRRGLMAFAGLWEHWERDGQVLDTCTIIVTSANSLMKPIHDRMPVILEKTQFADWLDRHNTRKDVLLPMLAPSSADHMEAYPVSRRVNHPKHDDPACLEPLVVE